MGRLFAFILVFGVAIGCADASATRRRPAAIRIASPRRRSRRKRNPARAQRSGHFYTYAKVNGELVRFVVDTGADVVALTGEDARAARRSG